MTAPQSDDKYERCQHSELSWDIFFCKAVCTKCGTFFVERETPLPELQPIIPDVDWLANVIRTNSGDHLRPIGAGTLAEKIVEAMHGTMKGTVSTSGVSFKPTHEHADGDVYERVSECQYKDLDNEWRAAVIYKARDGRLYCTSGNRWDSRFTALSARQERSK